MISVATKLALVIGKFRETRALKRVPAPVMVTGPIIANWGRHEPWQVGVMDGCLFRPVALALHQFLAAAVAKVESAQTASKKVSTRASSRVTGSEVSLRDVITTTPQLNDASA